MPAGGENTCESQTLVHQVGEQRRAPDRPAQSGQPREQVGAAEMPGREHASCPPPAADPGVGRPRGLLVVAARPAAVVIQVVARVLSRLRVDFRGGVGIGRHGVKRQGINGQ